MDFVNREVALQSSLPVAVVGIEGAGPMGWSRWVVVCCGCCLCLL